MTTSATRIARVAARQILDSRGRPTIEADVELTGGATGRACAPSGASRGRHEAWELRDGDADVYGRLGVERAVGNVKTEIAGALGGHDAADQRGVDDAMIALDGTPSLERLGANAVLAVSMATARAAAVAAGEPLYAYMADLAGTAPTMPMPMTNILSGGAHAGRGMDVQDFLCMPVGATSYSQALDMIFRVRSAAAALMQERGLTVLLADEGGLSPGFGAATEALDLIVCAFEAAKLRPGEDMAIALDVAASELYEDGGYVLAGEGKRYSPEAMTDFVVGMARRYPIASIEDGLEQDDWAGWRRLTEALPDVVTIEFIGDLPGDRVGCVRSTVNTLGMRVIERLVALSDLDHSGAYRVLEVGVPVENFVGRIRLLPLTAGDDTFIEWRSEFDYVGDGDPKETVKFLEAAVYMDCLNGLKRMCEGEAPR